MSLNQFPRRAFSGAATLQTFTGNGSTTTFTLSQEQFQNESFVFVDDVAQVPGVDFGINGTSLTFTSAPANNAEIIVRGFGVPTPLNNVSDGAITTAKIAESAITHSKLHTTAIQDKLGYTPVSPTQLTAEINNLIATAPGALNTLDELAAALGDDANFATTITNALATKATTTYVDNQIAAIDVSPTQVSDKVNSSTGYFDLPTGTTAQRPASPTTGMVRYNTTLDALEMYDGVVWTIVKSSFSATGGTIVSSGGYTYHAFTTSGTFQVSRGTKTAEVLLVAGGGGGGYQVGGGGGAGGLVYTSNFNLVPGNYTVTIGAGGAGTVNNTGGTSSNGGNTSITGATTAIGGGYGNNHSAGNYSSGASGGSGGGGGGRDSGQNSGGSGTAGQGNPGGTGMSSNWAGGGGGGAGGAGGNAGNNTGGAGGVGLQYSQFSQWGTSNPNVYSTTAGTALQNGGGWFAGGGGGSMNQQTDAGSFSNGGAGGGGRGYGDNGGVLGGSNHGEDGAPNTGGGGGGVRDVYGGGAYTRAGNGGSGILIIRYQI